MKVTVLAGHISGDEVEVSDQLINFVSRKVRRWVPFVGFAGYLSVPFVIELIRQIRRADVVHVSFARELIPALAAFIGVVLKRPLVLQPHGMLTARTSRLHRLLDRGVLRMYRQAGMVIALTDVEKLELEAWSGSDKPTIEVLGNPLPFVSSRSTREQQPTAPEDRNPSAVFIARLHPRKRVRDFVAARAIAEARGWSERYEVIGPDQGDAAAVLQGTARISGLVYTGAVAPSEIENILRNAGVFVLTSENEPWGNVLVAALSSGIPVVVTQSAALASEIQANYLGIVVPDRTPEAVATAVHEILAGAWRSEKQALHAQSFAQKRFDQEAIRVRLKEFYEGSLFRAGHRSDCGTIQS
jgi:glycosyltransferase involved in cell wall biosynthesis